MPDSHQLPALTLKTAKNAQSFSEFQPNLQTGTLFAFYFLRATGFVLSSHWKLLLRKNCANRGHSN
jgi:hypothetical protein